jgi:hypothetical protein
MAGVITSWSFKAGATGPTLLKFKVARDAGGGNWTIVGESTGQAPPANLLSTYPTRIPVQAGDVIGRYIVGAVPCSFSTGNAGDVYGITGGDPAPGTTASFLANTTVQIDLSARLERDADGDGYGDETQDQCFTDPSTQGPCPAPTVSGTAQVGQTLTGTPGGSPISPSYQWLDCDSAGANCTAISGATGTTYTVTSRDVGSTLRFRKTATDASGTQTGDSGPTAVVPPVTQPPHNSSPPTITGTPASGQVLTCSTGTWTNAPTGFAYQWSRDGTPIAGATSSSYTLQAQDAGANITCAVTASNAAGSASATSGPVRVQVPRCALASGRVVGQRLGVLKLGLTRRAARHLIKQNSTRGMAYQDFFCLRPTGIRVGYASPKLLRTLHRSRRDQFRGRVVWISSSNRRYAIRGIRPGATLQAARRRLKLGRRIRIGANDWYLGPAGSVTAVLKVRHGEVQEVGIAERSLTLTRRAQAIFMGSFG